jgi:tetratricopeptide (TPR) repeat protein
MEKRITALRCAALACVLVAQTSCKTASPTVTPPPRGNPSLAPAQSSERDCLRDYALVDYVKLENRLRNAYLASPDPKILRQLADVAWLMGNAADAYRWYRRYLAYLPHPPDRAEVQERLRLISEKCTQVRPGASRGMASDCSVADILRFHAYTFRAEGDFLRAEFYFNAYLCEQPDAPDRARIERILVKDAAARGPRPDE